MRPDQMRLTASSLLLSLKPPHFVGDAMALRMSEDSTKFSTILHWVSNVTSSNTATSLSHDVESSRFTFYLSSNSFHEPYMDNATRLLDLIRKSLSITSTGGDLSDLEDEYLAFVADVCWERIQNKVNNRVPRFPIVPDSADVSTTSSVLNIIIGLVEEWNAWRLETGLPEENSFQITEMGQELDHSRSVNTLKHCFEQAFRPLESTGDHLQQLRDLWRCCYALLKSNFFVDVFYERWLDDPVREVFLYRVYRRIWRLYSYWRGADILLFRGIPHLLSSTQDGCPPFINFCWVPQETAQTVRMDLPPDLFISQVGQRHKWRGDLAQDSHSTSKTLCLWSMNETRTVRVHPMVSLINFLNSSGIRVMENRIGTSRRPCVHCECYSECDRWHFLCARSSRKSRVDWAIPRTFPDDAKMAIAKTRDYAESLAFATLKRPFK